MTEREDLNEFKVECAEMLDRIESLFLSAEKGKTLSEFYDEAFRIFHSLKGAAGMLGLTELQGHVHQLETQFQTFKGKELPNGVASYFLLGVDGCRKLVGGESIQFDYSRIQGGAAKTTETLALRRKLDKPLIFVVDDEPEIVEIISDILVSSGYSVKGFTAPRDALASIKSLRPVMVISDVKMPEMTGLELVKEIRKLDSDLPIVLVSGYLNKEMAVEALNTGASSVIEKPFSDGQIIATAAQCVKRAHVLRLLNQSINFIMYQFSDLDQFLIDSGKKEVRDLMQAELQQILQARRQLRSLN